MCVYCSVTLVYMGGADGCGQYSNFLELVFGALVLLVGLTELEEGEPERLKRSCSVSHTESNLVCLFAWCFFVSNVFVFSSSGSVFSILCVVCIPSIGLFAGGWWWSPLTSHTVSGRYGYQSQGHTPSEFLPLILFTS